MKRIISTLMVFTMLFCLSPINSSAVTVGDVDGDGHLTPADSYCIKLHLAGRTDLDADAFDAADMNRDGKVTSVDSLILKRSLSGVQEKGYRLVVNDKDITKSSYEFYQFSGVIEVPILAVCEAMGAKVTYRTDSIVDIAFDKIPGIEYYRENYVLFLDEQRLVEAEYEGYDYNIIKPVPGGTMKCRTHDGDVVVDFLTFRGLTLSIFSDVGFDFKLDHENKTIYIWGEM